jgi:hypothetical protein
MPTITLSARGTRRLQFLAALWLWLEALLIWLAPALWLVLALATLAVWGVLFALPPWLQMTMTFIFWLLVFYLLWRGHARILWPNSARIKARLEQAGKLPHQPLQTLADYPVQTSALRDVLWQHHRFSAAQDLAALRWPRLHAQFAPRDLYATRFVLVLLLLLGALWQPTLAWPRLQAAFMPQPMAALAQLGPSAWHITITPPEYTNLPTLYLSSSKALPEKLSIPSGSQMTLRVMGGKIKPVLYLEDIKHKFSQQENNLFMLNQLAVQGDHIFVRQGIFPLLNLPVILVPSQPPALAVRAIQSLPRGQWQLDLCAQDQYRLTAVTLHFQGFDNPAIERRREFIVNSREDCGVRILDLAASPLAGKAAWFWVTARNTAGLMRQSEKQKIILPTYDFKNQLAQALANARQNYMLDNNQRAELLQVIANVKKNKMPVTVFLALQNAENELTTSDDRGALADLWQAILRLEEGSYADIAANWRAARDDLLAALPNWQINETVLQKLVYQASDSWGAFAPAYGYDGALFDDHWQQVADWIASGQRRRAVAAVSQWDTLPGDILAMRLDDKPDDRSIETLQKIRAQMNDPALPDAQRIYLEKIIQSGE